MFDQFREKLQSVQQDLSTGLKTLSAKAQMVGKTSRFSDDLHMKGHSLPSLKSGLHISAGADLLQKFQKSWEEIHTNTESSAAKATQVDETLQGLVMGYERRCELWLQLQRQLTDLPSMVEDIQRITTSLGKLTAEFEEVESLMFEFEDTLEEVDHHSNKLARHEELQRYKDQKLEEQKTLKERMHEEFKQKVRQREMLEEANQKERQMAFEEFFVADMQHYKTHGKMEISLDVAQHHTHLQDFDLVVDEQDLQALDDFLDSGGSDDLTLTSTGSIAEEALSSDEEAPPAIHAPAVESEPEEVEESSDYSRESEDVTDPSRNRALSNHSPATSHDECEQTANQTVLPFEETAPAVEEKVAPSEETSTEQQKKSDA